MNGLDFVAQIVATGQVNGTGIGADLEAVTQAINVPFVDNMPGRRKTVLVRDYGLVEFTFNRTGETWVCGNFSAKLHRLETVAEVHADWHQAHGVDLPARITLAELQGQLAREYHLAEPVERSQAGALYFRYPASNATVLVLDDPADQPIPPGDREVFSVSVHPE